MIRLPSTTGGSQHGGVYKCLQTRGLGRRGLLPSVYLCLPSRIYPSKTWYFLGSTNVTLSVIFTFASGDWQYSESATVKERVRPGLMTSSVEGTINGESGRRRKRFQLISKIKIKGRYGLRYAENRKIWRNRP